MALSTFPIAQELWSFAFTAFGVIGVMPTQVTFCFHGEEHLAVIETSFGKQLLIASCGPFGERETTGLLSIVLQLALIKIYCTPTGQGEGFHVTLLLIFWTIRMFVCNCLWKLAILSYYFLWIKYFTYKTKFSTFLCWIVQCKNWLLIHLWASNDTWSFNTMVKVCNYRNFKDTDFLKRHQNFFQNSQ